MDIPFVYGKIVEGRQFINRTKEVANLQLYLKSRLSTILISPRRWGKSSLVNEVAGKLEKKDKKIKFCFIDLYSIRGEEEFYQVFASELLKTTSNKWEEWVSNGKKFITQIIPQFSVGIDPINDFKVAFDWKQVKKKGSEILNLPEMISKDKNIQIVVCIDEFQNIAHFEEPLEMQKLMRSVWQKHQFCTYCLYGSKRHMLAEIFENKSMPFYKFGETIFIDKIDRSHWVKYIVKQFEGTQKKISNEQAGRIANDMENHPYFVQLFASTVWKLTKKNCTDELVDKALEELILQYSIMYQREMDNLTNKQLGFLKALFDGVEKFSSKKTLDSYNLGTQGNINRIRIALENKEIIDMWGPKIEFVDPLFKIWFGKIFYK
jgi:hypothetical protein